MGIVARIMAVMAAVVFGAVAGFASGSTVAMAVPRPLPEFSLIRPDYMQGVDAANAATSRGTIDFITRSKIDALQFPKAREEVRKQEAAFKMAPSREQRVQRAQAQAERLAVFLEIPS